MFCRHIQRYGFFVWYNTWTFRRSQWEVPLNCCGNLLKTVLDEVHFMVSVHSFSLSPSLPGKPFVPQVRHLLPFQAEQLPKLPPPLDTSTITLVFIVLLILSHSLANLENSMIKRWRQIELLEAIFFLSPNKNNKKAYRLCMEFSWNHNTCVQRCFNPLIQRTLLLLPLFFKDISTLRSGSTKW